MSATLLFALQMLIYSACPFALATLRSSVRATAFYVLIAIYLVIGGFLGAVYSFPLLGSVNISGGNLAYGAFMMTAVLFVIVEKKIRVLRNVIWLVIGVNLFKLAFFSTISWALRNQIVLNPNNTSFAVFRTSVFFVLLGGALIVLELLLFVIVFEQLKKRITNVVALSLSFVAVFLLVLCFDGILFPTIAFGFSPQLVDIVIGGVGGKLVMGSAYAVPILLFLGLFKRRLVAYAADPVLRPRWWRVPESELQAELRAKEEALRESERALTTLMSNLPGMAFRCQIDANWTMEFVSDGCEALTGYPAADLVEGQRITFAQIVHPDDRERASEEVQAALREDKSFQLSYRIVTASGEEKTVWELGRGVVANDSSVMLEGFVMDVTERLRAIEALRESEERLRTAQEAGRIGAWEWDLSANTFHVSDMFARIHGMRKNIYSRDEMLRLLLPEDVAMIDEAFRRTMEEGQLYDMEHRIIRENDGEIRWVHGRGDLRRNESGEPIAVTGTSIDVTDRKKAELALRESERSLAYAQQLAHLGNWVWDVKSGEVSWSDEVYRIFGLDPATFRPNVDSVMERFHPDDRRTHETVMAEAIAHREQYTFEARILRPDGHERIVFSTSEGHHNETGDLVRISGTVQDITERKQIEEQLRFTQFVVDRASVAAYWSTPDGRFVYVNDAACRSLGYSREELLSMTVHDIDPAFPPEIWPDHWRRIRERGSFAIESRHLRKDGSTFPAEITVNHVRFGGEEFNCAFVEDITDRKEAEIALRESEAKYKRVSDNSPAVLYQYLMTPDSRFSFPYVSDIVEDVLGVTAEEAMKNPMKLLGTIHPDDREMFQQGIERAATSLESFPLVFRCIKDGDVIWIEARGMPTPLEDGGILWDGFLIDITERKQAEQQLRASEELLREAQQIAHIAHWTFDPATGMPWWSEELYRIYGRDPADGPLPYSEHPKLVHPDDWDWFDATVQATAKSGEPFDITLRILRPDGSVRYINSICQPITDDTGAVIEMRGTIQDVTERERAANALKASEGQFRSLYENSPFGILLCEILRDKDGRAVDFIHLEANDATARHTGFKKTDLVGKKASELVDPETQVALTEKYDLVVRTGRPIDYIQYFDVYEKTLQVTVFPLAGDRFIINFIDVTEQNRVEEALKTSERQYRLLTENSRDVIFRTRISDGAYEYVSPSTTTAFGYDPEDFYENPQLLLEMLQEGWESYFREKWSEIRAGERPPSYEFPIVHRSTGETRWMLQSNVWITDEHGELVALQGRVSDITQRKHAESTLQDRVRELAALHDLGLNMSRSLALRDVGQAAIDGAVAAVEPDLALLFLREGQDLVLTSAGPEDSGLEHDAPPVHRLGECLCGLAVAEGGGVYSLDIREDPRCTWTECKVAGVRSFAALPLQSGDEVIGVLGLASTTKRDFEAQRSFLETLANETARGIQNALLYEEVTAHGVELELRAAERELLYALAQLTEQRLSVLDLMERVTKLLADALRPDATMLYEVVDDRLKLRASTPQDDRTARLGSEVKQCGECLCGLAASEGRALYSSNMAGDPRVTHEVCVEAGIRSFAALPLVIRGAVVGVISLASRSERDFESEASFLKTVAKQASAVLENTELREAAERYTEELEGRVAERTSELAAAKDRAESADRLKSAFLSTMSHELRTPLNSILGFTGILLQGLAGPLSAEQEKQLGMVRTSAAHLLSLINDVLDISKIEAGEIRPTFAPFPMSEAVEGVVASLTPQADERGLALETRIAADVAIVHSDRRRVDQILTNLIGNAIKFTDEGGIRVECESIEDRITVRVRDTGIGIHAEDLERLFEPFAQLNSGLDRPHDGTGLGLAISQRLAKLLGATIRAESEGLGKGSLFTFELPIERPQEDV